METEEYPRLRSTMPDFRKVFFSAGEEAAGEVRAQFSEHGAEKDQEGDNGDWDREEQCQRDKRFQRDPGIAEFLYDRQKILMQHIDEERKRRKI